MTQIEAANDDHIQVLTFDIRGETFALEAGLVREILDLPDETAVPGAAAGSAGVVGSMAADARGSRGPTSATTRAATPWSSHRCPSSSLPPPSRSAKLRTAVQSRSAAHAEVHARSAASRPSTAIVSCTNIAAAVDGGHDVPRAKEA